MQIYLQNFSLFIDKNEWWNTCSVSSELFFSISRLLTLCSFILVVTVVYSTRLLQIGFKAPSLKLCLRKLFLYYSKLASSSKFILLFVQFKQCICVHSLIHLQSAFHFDIIFLYSLRSWISLPLLLILRKVENRFSHGAVNFSRIIFLVSLLSINVQRVQAIFLTILSMSRK